MSKYEMKILLGAAVAAIIVVGFAATAMPAATQLGVGFSTQGQQSGANASTILPPSTSTTLQGAQSLLVLQLTDPPIVPQGTSSLNMTYTAINLLVTEPSLVTSSTSTTSITSTVTTTVTCGTTTTSTTTTSSPSSQSGPVTSHSITITPKGGAASVNLLKLENISQTIASANLPSGSTLYSVSFTVSGIQIRINGVNYPVTIATGGNSILVTLENPVVLYGTNIVLLDLNPTIINTPTGYQMIPSSVGVLRPQSEIVHEDNNLGSQHQLNDQDQDELNHARGQISANLTALSVSGNITTIAVQVNNIGNCPIKLVAIALQGNFTAQNCVATNPWKDDHDHSRQWHYCPSPNIVIFVPTLTPVSSTTSSSSSTSSTTTSTASCASGQLTLINTGGGRSDDDNLVALAPGHCITLKFSGTITFGQPGVVIVPSTLPGQTYVVQVIAWNSAELRLSCTLPLSKTSCKVIS